MSFCSIVKSLLAGTLFLLPAAVHAEWLRADSDHFVIYSEGSSGELERFARDTERFDALLRRYFGLPAAGDGENRLTIYALESAADIGRLMGDANTGIAGFYQNRSDGSFAVTNRERTNTKFALSGQTTLFHEYAHHFMFRHLTNAYPAWYVEGFAEYFSTAEFEDDGRWDIGKPAYHRARTLLGDGRLGLDELLFGTTAGMTVAEADLYYGRAWMLVHMAMSDPERGEQLRGYLRDFANGVDPKLAAKDNFGSLPELESALENYVNESLHFRSSSTPMPYNGRLEVRELNLVQSELVELRLERRMETDLAATRAALVELTGEAPTSADAWHELAMTELALARKADAKKTDTPGQNAVGDGEPEQGDLTETEPASPERRAHEAAAEAALDKALALNPKHVRARVQKAQLEMRRLARAGEDSMRAWSGPRVMLLDAHHTDPSDPQPLFAYYQSFAKAGAAPPEVARTAIRQAFVLAPESSRIRMSYVNDLVANGEIAPAIVHLKVIAYNPHGGGALEFLQRLQSRLADETSGPKAPADLLPAE